MRDRIGFLVSVATHGFPLYLAEALRTRPRPTHVLFCMVDHFEPGTGDVDVGTEQQRMAELVLKYPVLADAHADSSGQRPRRTWFFPPHYHRYGNLRELVALCERGYGEIELHLHHGKTEPDTADNVRRTIELCLRDYSRFGVFGREGGRQRYGFIHGDWALNNSLPDGRLCGVDRELSILQETGCYADFTFPSCARSNPVQINRIYYADVDRHWPKSYATGALARAGAGPQAGLLMIQGPVRPVLVGGKPTFGDAIDHGRPPSRKIIDGWVATWIHVAGKPDWVIVKSHTHGAVSGDTVLGRPMHQAFSYLEAAYNDGSAYVLHYVTARELYNIIRAAEAGEVGDPDEYRDYCVAPPSYDSSPDVVEASADLREAVSRTYRG